MSESERIAGLERAARRLSLATAALALALGVGVATGAAAGPGVLRATELHLVGDDGEDYAVVGSHGGATVIGLGPEGRGGCVVIGANGDGSANLTVMSYKYKSGVRLAVGPDGEPSVRVRDLEGRTVSDLP